MADVGDVIELIADLPERNLRMGLPGAIVHRHTDEAYEVEFSDDDGQTTDLVVLHQGQFIVVWRAETEQWVAISEQIASLLTSLPEEATTEVLDFARFLVLKSQLPARKKQVPVTVTSQA